MNLVRKLSDWWARAWGVKPRLLLAIWWLLVATAGSVFIWRFGPGVWALFQDEEGFEAFVAGLGWLGPPALVTFNALQIVVAPIPGYVVQAAAGYLYGPFWGGVWGSLGLVSGASLAMWLSRRYGRALVARMIGGERLARWEEATHSESTMLWFVLIFAPTGDLPYFLAGLSRVSFAKVLLLTLAIRVPATFVVAAIGAGAVGLSWWQLSLLILLLACGFGLVMRNQAALLRWVDRTVQQRVSG